MVDIFNLKRCAIFIFAVICSVKKMVHHPYKKQVEKTGRTLEQFCLNMRGILAIYKTIRPDVNLNCTYLKEKQLMILTSRKLGKKDNIGDKSWNA